MVVNTLTNELQLGCWSYIGWFLGMGNFSVNVAITIIETKVHGPLFIDLWIDFMSFTAWNDQPQWANAASSLINKMVLNFRIGSNVDKAVHYKQSNITSTLWYSILSNYIAIIWNSEDENRFDIQILHADQLICSKLKDTHQTDFVCGIQTTISNVWGKQVNNN